MAPKHTFYNDGREEALHDYIFSQPLEAIRGSPTAVHQAINDHIRTGKRMMVFEKEKIDVAREQLLKMPIKPKVIIELGTYIGTSALAWGSILKDLHATSETGLQQCKVISCELEPKFVKIAQDFVELAGLRHLVQIMQGPAADTIQKLYQEGIINSGGVDVLFLDHWEQMYVPDLKVCETLGLFRKGTLLVADNTDVPGAPDYLEYIESGDGKVKYKNEAISCTTKMGVPKIVEVSEVIEFM